LPELVATEICLYFAQLALTEIRSRYVMSGRPKFGQIQLSQPWLVFGQVGPISNLVVLDRVDPYQNWSYSADSVSTKI